VFQYKYKNEESITMAKPILDLMQGIHKSVSSACRCAAGRVGMRLFPGEVHALMGQNGAGKSTLIKVLTGVHPADGGTMRLGRPRRSGPSRRRPRRRWASATVYQEVNLCPNLSVAENILAGRMPRRWGWIDWGAVHERRWPASSRCRSSWTPIVTLREYPVAVQQMVAIARAVSQDARLLILDEPTSSLDEAETERLFTVMRRLKAQGRRDPLRHPLP
jgi:monosaccharide-transporting ATPase